MPNAAFKLVFRVEVRPPAAVVPRLLTVIATTFVTPVTVLATVAVAGDTAATTGLRATPIRQELY